jgi:Arc/MetJ-type ribon-helix-helix transcriptional regulator
VPGMGRPPLPEPASRKSVKLPDSLWADIDRVRKTFDRIPSEAEVIRILLREAIDARLKDRRIKK